MFIFPCFLLKFGSAPIPWLMGGKHGDVGGWVPEASVRNGAGNLRGGCPERWHLKTKGCQKQFPLIGMAFGGVRSQGSLLGSCKGDRVCGLLWPFCFFCVCSGRSQGDKKSRSLLCPQLLDWGHRPCVIRADEPSHCRGC